MADEGIREQSYNTKGKILGDEIADGQIELKHLSPGLFSEIALIGTHRHTGGMSGQRIGSMGLRDRSVGNRKIGDWDGWILDSETWIYDSPNSFKIPGDQTDKFQIGDKIKLTQTTGGIKLFRISSDPTFSSSYTTLRVWGLGFFALTNESISSPFYSKILSPQGWPFREDMIVGNGTLAASTSTTEYIPIDYDGVSTNRAYILTVRMSGDNTEIVGVWVVAFATPDVRCGFTQLLYKSYSLGTIGVLTEDGGAQWTYQTGAGNTVRVDITAGNSGTYSWSWSLRLLI